MSSNDVYDISNQVVVSILYQQYRFDVAAATLLVYDIILTWGREKTCIWERKFSGVTVIFVVLRYATLVEQVMKIGAEAQLGILVPCQAFVYGYFVATILSRLASAAFHALRIWAIWGRHWIILAIVSPVSLISVCFATYQITQLQIYASDLPLPMGGCIPASAISPELDFRLSIASRSCVILSDFMIVTATWIRTWSVLRGLKATRMYADVWRFSLPGLLLRDGTLYFLALLCLNVCGIILYANPTGSANPILAFIEVFTSILLCRLILNLRSFDTSNPNSLPSHDHKPISSVRFAHVVLSNIGAPVVPYYKNYYEGNRERRSGILYASMNEVVGNPLAVGLEEEIRMALTRETELTLYPSREKDNRDEV